LIKKITSSFIILVYCITLNNPAQARVYFDDNGRMYTQEQIDNNKLQIERNKQEQIRQEESNRKYIESVGISCRDNPADENCFFIDVSLSKTDLESYLNENYQAYKVTLINHYNKPLDIIGLSGFIKPAEQINKIIDKRKEKRFPNSILYIAGTPIITVAWALLLPVMPLAHYLGECPDEMLYAPIYYPVTGIWYTIAAPYYYFADKKTDGVAKKEANGLLSDYKTLTIQPNEKTEFTILSFLSKNKPVLFLQFKIQGEDKIIKVRY